MEIELNKYFGEQVRQTVLSMEGFREMAPHPEGGTTLTFERATSAHKVSDLVRQRDGEGAEAPSRAQQLAAGAKLAGRQDWRHLPSIEHVRVAEDIGTVAEKLSTARNSAPGQRM